MDSSRVLMREETDVQGDEQNACIWILDSSVFVFVGYIPICHRSLGF